ncbi:hypothetical protein SHDE107825_17225 [Shewanella denitrificans]|jgi:hypothetical protein
MSTMMNLYTRLSAMVTTRVGALAAIMANKRVDIGLIHSCDSATERVHYIRVKN